MKQIAYSDSFKVFLGLICLIVLTNLFLVNDYAALWNGPETNILLAIQNAEANHLVSMITESIYQPKGLHLFWLRLPGVLILLISAGVFFLFGKKIFGRDAVVLTLLISASSFLLVNTSKFISADVYLLMSQWLLIVFSILYIKQPISKWRWISYLLLFFGLWFHPVSMTGWIVLFGTVLYLLHPKKEAIKNLLIPIVPIMILLMIGVRFFYGKWEPSEFLFSYGLLSPSKTLAYLLLGMLPWLGFLPAALWDLKKKLESKEEMSIIILAWFLASILSLSLSLVIVLSFMIGKQVWVVLKPGYPYLRLVKGFALLNLIAAFFIILLALLGGLTWFGGGGYRSIMALGFVYWLFSFLGVLGLFLQDRRVVIAGFVFSGVIATLTFWGNVYPAFDKARQLPRLLVEEATKKKLSGIEKLSVSDADWAKEPAFTIYANKHFSEWTIFNDSLNIQQQFEAARHQLFLIDNKVYPNLDSTLTHRATIVEHEAGWGRRGTLVYILGK